METQPPATAWLEGPEGQRTPIRGTCCLGRAAGGQIVLSDNKVSRRHAMVHAQGEDEFWIIDLGSANGTYVNDRRVAHPCQLSDQDQIRVGEHCFTFRHSMPRPAAASDSISTDRTAQEIRTIRCWLVVADIEGSTRLVQRRPPEEAARITGRWLAGCKQIVDRHEGTINKFLGDGFLAYWLGRQEAAVSVAGALTALKLLQAKATPPFRVVAHYGQVLAGGGGSLGEESLLGNEVNLVFRLEKLAGSLGAPRLLTQAAHDQLQSHMTTKEVGRHSLQGFDGEFLLYEF